MEDIWEAHIQLTRQLNLIKTAQNNTGYIEDVLKTPKDLHENLNLAISTLTQLL